MLSFLKKKNFKSIEAREINNLGSKIDLIDVREPEEYKAGHVPGARNIPMETLTENPEKYINKSNQCYIICQSGKRSEGVCHRLADMGFSVVNVKGGTSSYAGELEK